MKLLLAWCTVSVTLMGQECRVTPLSPAQPPFQVAEGERATESQTFQTGPLPNSAATSLLAISPTNQLHFFDTATRLRRIESNMGSNGRLTTLAGNGSPGDGLMAGPALTTPLPTVAQLLFSPLGTLHFVAAAAGS